MSKLTYSILCEDKAHYLFITKYLTLFSNKNKLKLTFKDDFYYRFKSANSKEVLKKYVNASVIAFRDYNLDFLIIGIDYDDRNRNNFDKEIEHLYSKLYNQFSHKSIIMFPVQAIEHWLLYIKYHQENPKSTKNISFEQIPRKEAKNKIYGINKYAPDVEYIIDSCMHNIYPDWLITRSKSFKKFQSDIIDKLINQN